MVVFDATVSWVENKLVVLVQHRMHCFQSKVSGISSRCVFRWGTRWAYSRIDGWRRSSRLNSITEGYSLLPGSSPHLGYWDLMWFDVGPNLRITVAPHLRVTGTGETVHAPSTILMRSACKHTTEVTTPKVKNLHVPTSHEITPSNYYLDQRYIYHISRWTVSLMTLKLREGMPVDSQVKLPEVHCALYHVLT